MAATCHHQDAPFVRRPRHQARLSSHLNDKSKSQVTLGLNVSPPWRSTAAGDDQLQLRRFFEYKNHLTSGLRLASENQDTRSGGEELAPRHATTPAGDGESAPIHGRTGKLKGRRS
uniref:Uncharacterized protein n=1 Tax=Oryza meridionalis TaxID=40149 RepID=A0A0E0EFC1_9ORYZ